MAWGDDAKKLGSGLVDRMQFTINKARFAFPYEKRPEDCALVLDGERNIDGEVEDDHVWLKVGAFEPGDAEGTFIVHDTDPGNPRKKINKRSNYGKFLESAFEVNVPLEEVQDAGRNEHEVRDALMWEGLILDIEYQEEKFTLTKGPDAGKEVTSRQPYIRGYLGKSGATGAAETTTAGQSSAPASSNGAMSEEKATELAKAATSHINFLENFQAAGGDVNSAMASKSWYEGARS